MGRQGCRRRAASRQIASVQGRRYQARRWNTQERVHQSFAKWESRCVCQSDAKR